MIKHAFSLSKRFGKRRALVAAVAASAVLAGGLIAATGPNPPATAESPELKVDHAAVDHAHVSPGSFAPVVKKVAPSVVQVFVTSKNPVQRRQMSADQMEQFRRFFGHGQQFGGDGDNSPGEMNPFGGQSPALHGLGSGVIVSADGYILTNNHVVGNASEIRVALADSREFPAKVVGTDPKTDLALIKIEAKDLPALTLTDSDEVAVGDVVLAIGNPFGIGQTVTKGIVSAKDRVTGGSQDEDFIQTDAAINPGNSGGALVDVEGRLVGINTAILSRSGGFQGVGFAIPSNLCQWVMTSLVKNGRVDRGFLGVNIQSLTPALAKQFKLDRIDGALVSDVTAGGPADKAGLKSGDVIREFNGEAVKDASQFKLQVAQTAPGAKATVQLIRDNQPKTLEITLGQFADDKLATNQSNAARGDEKDALAGVGVTDLNQNIRAQAKIPSEVDGAVITEVAPNSPAYEAGLRPGDVITEINREEVKNARDAVAKTEKPVGDETLVKVWSHGGSRYVTVDERKIG
jgi:Do/DeqQ family serine protease